MTSCRNPNGLGMDLKTESYAVSSPELSLCLITEALLSWPCSFQAPSSGTIGLTCGRIIDMVLLSLNPEVTLNYALFLNYCFEQSPRDYALGGNVSFRVTSTTNFIHLLHLGWEMSAITLSQNCSNPCVLLSQMQSPDWTTPLLRIYHSLYLPQK